MNTLTTMSAALQPTFTSDTMLEMLFQSNPFLDSLRKRMKYNDGIGEEARTVVHVGRGSGYTASPANNASLNAATNQSLAQAIWQWTHHNQQIALQGSVIDGAKTNVQSVINSVDLEISHALKDMEKQITRQLFGNGDGRITACGTTSSSTTVVLSTTDGYDALERGWLFVGATVDIGTAGSPTSLANGETITAVSVDTTTPTITIASTISTTSSNFVSWKGNRTGTAATYESNGLRNIVSESSTLGGLTVAANPTWKAAKVSDVSAAFDLSDAYTHRRAVQQQTGTPPDLMLTSLKQQQKLFEQLQPQIRYAPAGNMDSGRVEVPTFNGMKLEAHNDCPNGDMYFLTEKDIVLLAQDKPYWQNKHTGGDILAWIQGTDTFGAKLTFRYNLVAERRNSHARMYNLS